MSVLEVRNLKKSFGKDTVVLKGVDFSLEKGETVQELDVVKNEDAGLQYVLDTTKTLIAEEREVLAIAAEVGDEVTVSLMSDYLAGQEKLVWMLAAYNTEA